MTVDQYRPRCYLDIEIDDVRVGRIVVELFSDVCPKTSQNFRSLCNGEKGIGKSTNKPLSYKDCPFHRVVKNFVIQGGDFVNGDGTGGESIYGGQFEDENFIVQHDEPYLLSMANRGKDTNGSQFFITTTVTPHLNGQHTVFGKVIEGKDVVTLIENIETDSSCRPLKDVRIHDCGELIRRIKKERKKKREISGSSDSESDSDDLKIKKKKKKKKHSKKHKRDRKEHRSLSAGRNDDDIACSINPEEIPSIPTNKFLLRNTSPLADANRRDIPRSREPYSFQRRPSRSKSGRKIKGRGHMRYRTPSPTGSRSGSETPPHWKQAQSKLRNIKEMLPIQEPLSPESSKSQTEDNEMVVRNAMLQSRLGMMSKSAEVDNQSDARNHLNARSNRRSREWSPEEYRNIKETKHMLFKRLISESDDRQQSKKFQVYSPPHKERSSSPLRSKIVVKASKNFEDRYSDKKYGRDFERKSRRDSPERKSYGGHFDRNNSSSDKRAFGSHFDRSPTSRFQNSSSTRRSDFNQHERKRYEHPREEKVTPKIQEPVVNKKPSTALQNDLLKYVKFSMDDDSSEEEVEKSPVLESTLSKDSVQQKATAVNDTQRENEFLVLKSIEECESQNAKTDTVDKSSSIAVKTDDSFKIAKSNTNSPLNISSESTGQRKNSIEVYSSIVAYEENNSEDKLEINQTPKELRVIPLIENIENSKSQCVLPNLSVETHSPSSIPSALEIKEENEAETDEILDNLCVNVSQNTKLVDRSPSQDSLKSNIVEPNYFQLNSAFDLRLPDVIPLPEESICKSPTPHQEENSISHDVPEPMDVGVVPSADTVAGQQDSNSEVMKDNMVSTALEQRDKLLKPKNASPRSPLETPPRSDRSCSPIQKKSPVRKSARSPRSNSPSSPVRKRQPSKSSRDRHVSSSRMRQTSVDRRSSPAQKSRSSPSRQTARSTETHRSRSRSRSSRRSSSRNRIRRRTSGSPVRRSHSRPRNDRGSRFYHSQGMRNRSPDRRGAYHRQYNKSPSYRGRIRGARRSRSKSRSRSLTRRRLRDKRSTSSSSASSSSSETSRKKKVRRHAKKKRSSSSSSSSSNSSGSHSH